MAYLLTERAMRAQTWKITTLGCSALLSLALAPWSAQGATRSDKASIAQTRIVLERFITAYNQHDLAAVRSLATPHVRWIDCDYTTHNAVHMHGKHALTTWLQSQFAQHDQLHVSSILAGGWNNDTFTPRSFGVMGTRTNDVIEAQGMPPQSIDGSKGLLNSRGTKIAFYLVRDQSECTASTQKPPVESLA
jgi:hypothetical protein